MTKKPIRGAALALIASQETPHHFLLTKRESPQSATTHQRWQLSGGAVEPDEKPEDTVRRELEEELGLDNLTFELLGEMVIVNQDLADAATPLYLFLCFYPLNEPLPEILDDEASERKWFSAEALAETEVLSAVNKAIELFQTRQHLVHD